ncbi:MAG: hypothetical protein JJV98_02545 [Desulfosarcina sp.]|nr:hypothetical protein [Desulfobacterales bacterium]
MFQTWTQAMDGMTSPNTPKEDKTRQTKASFDTAMKAFSNFSRIVSEPDSMESLFKSAGALPQILAKTAQTGLSGFLKFQQKWLERAGKMGKSTEAYKFEDLDENAFRAWAEIYETEFKQFFNIPQLGLTRFYQEKMNQAVDKFNIFQTAQAEFQRLLHLPITRSFGVMQEKLGEMAKDGVLPEDAKTYYQMWVKILEGHYMTLFQSPEYTHTLGQTMAAMSEFSRAKNEVIQDMLGMFPVPTEKEMDELYKEIYLLKKRINALEK